MTYLSLLFVDTHKLEGRLSINFTEWGSTSHIYQDAEYRQSLIKCLNLLVRMDFVSTHRQPYDYLRRISGSAKTTLSNLRRY